MHFFLSPNEADQARQDKAGDLADVTHRVDAARRKAGYNASPKSLQAMTDWSHCPAVVSRPGFLSGKPALRDDPRVPPETIVDNMDSGESAQQVIENFGLRTPLCDVLAIYEYAKERQPHPAA